MHKRNWWSWLALTWLAAPGLAAGAAEEPAEDLVIAERGVTSATVVVAPDAGPYEAMAAADLVKYIGLMTGARPALATNSGAIAAALRGAAPVLLVGAEALKAAPGLRPRLAAAAKPRPVLRADAIVLQRDGRRVFLAGNHDEAHYYAVAELLRRWGCRWFLPTEFGECIPERPRLAIGPLDFAYGPPFEIRSYWLSWLGDDAGREEFKRRNFMNSQGVPSGHCLAQYTRDIAPGGDVFKVPISEPATAEHVARQLAPRFAKGERISLGMEDGLYQSASASDRELMGLQYDKYFLMPSVTDAFVVFYNRVARFLRTQYPASPSRIGFLAYSNLTLPPVRPAVAEEPLVAYLAPIDIDPIHGMDDPKSPPRQEYREMMYRWARVMQGRLAIYDYDQGMLAWRDLPNPSLASIRQDIRHYRRAGILGVDTESRGAAATTFINLYLRGRLMWNPEEDPDALLADFYPAFYGLAAAPMAAYWNAIFEAWAASIVTEHEYFVAPAIYTPSLLATLGRHLAEAEALARPLTAQARPNRNERLILDRLEFTRLSFTILENYLAMVRAAATGADYGAAVAAGERGLAAREQLASRNGTFTTYRRIGESGPAWWPGEVQQYRELQQYVAGTNGTLICRLPLEWAFRRDPDNLGIAGHWATQAEDLAFWRERGTAFTLENRKDYPPGEWELVRTDLYLQAQGIRHPDQQSYTGHGWYSTGVDLTAEQAAGRVRLMFPGLFNECWLYVNGVEAAHRTLPSALWWNNDYKFQWEVDLAGKLKPGANRITLRIHNPHHLGGMFRRPFLFRAQP